MRIILTIKAVLNYLKTHLIDLVWVKVLRFSDGTEMDTVPVGNNIYDIKMLSQAIADKGWACMCHTTRQDLSKEDVPTVFADILDKYNNCDKGELPWTDGASYTETAFWGGQRFIGCHNNTVYIADEHSICSSSNPINTAFTQVFWKRFLRYGTLFCGSKWLIIGGSSDRYNVDSLVIMNYETNDTKEISFSGGSSLFFKEIGNYIYIVSNTNNKIYRIINNDYDNITSDNLELVIDFAGTSYSNIVDILYDNDNSVWYFVTLSDPRYAYTHIHKATNISDISTYTTDVWVSPNYYDNGVYSRIFKSNNRIMIVVPYKEYLKLWYTDNSFSSVTALSDVSYGRTDNLNAGCICTQKNTDIYITSLVTFRSGGNNYSFAILINININSTASSVSQLYGTDKGYGDLSNIVFDNNDHNFIFWNYGIHYSGLAPITYTDTYQINGSSVAINYYKYNDWKICLPNPTNDTNLDTVYSFLGYLNYWRLDLSEGSETVSLPRNSKLWSFMFVGDNYQDSNLPTGNYVLPVSYIVEKYDDGNGNGYNLYNDNQIEIYGVHNFNSSEYSATISVTLSKTMRDNKYNITIVCGRNSNNACAMGYGTKNKTTTGFDVQILQVGSSDYCDYVLWSVKGYIANS